MPISAVILAKNEEKNIIEAIKSVGFCDEILVIDDQSTDKTTSLATQLGATVISHPLNNDFSQQRNFALTKATCEWVLYLDADERVSKELQEEIVKTVQNATNVSGYYLRRIDFMWGKFLKHGETGNVYLLRLAKKDAGTWVGKVHETWISTEPTQELSHPLYHYPHVNVTEFLQEINFYSDIRAKELFGQKVQANVFTILAYPTGKFIQNYLAKRGFQDGTAGLVLALLMSFHSFLVRGKLWQLWQNSRKTQ